jgi:hypothetical protein
MHAGASVCCDISEIYTPVPYAVYGSLYDVVGLVGVNIDRNMTILPGYSFNKIALKLHQRPP